MSTFPLTQKFTDALALAQQWHTGQYRKGTEIPYISHLLGVASIALEFGATEQQAIAALLHDALEDGPENTGINAADLRATIETTFGAEVALLVDGATDAMPEAGKPKEPWAKRKLDYLEKLHHEDASALLVSAADKLHNARTILTEIMLAPEGEHDQFFTRFKQGKEGTLQYYRLLADTYLKVQGGQNQPRLQALFSELERTVSALETACQVTTEQVRAYPLLIKEGG